MKGNLVGRVVGFSQHHKMVPANCRDQSGPQVSMLRTVWGRVTADHRNDPELIVVRDLHTGLHAIVRRDTIHTSFAKRP